MVFLQVPLLPSTRHMINDDVLPKLKKGMTLINTSRGGEHLPRPTDIPQGPRTCAIYVTAERWRSLICF